MFRGFPNAESPNFADHFRERWYNKSENIAKRVKKMKKLLLVGLLLLFGFSVSGCTVGSYTVVNALKDNTATRMSMSYDRLNGYLETQVTVTEGSPLEIVVEFETISGRLDASICRLEDPETCSYEGVEVQTSSFTVTLIYATTYVIRVDARRHEGSYFFDWAD